MNALRTVGIVGFGRFGQAFAGLCEEAGLGVRAYEPSGAVPERYRAATPAELLAAADVVVLAVPLDRFEEALHGLAPQLRPGQIVVDVGSVKVVPRDAMERQLGTRIPWVATHPLFGPASLARGERPLDVVVCPSPIHPEAVAAVEALFLKLGCQVVRQSAEDHDREMALTHALTFFVAKGLLDAGVPAEAPHAPPSFQGMARTIDAVRVDAGHLLPALHRYNPYAAAARRKLLEALGALDKSLAHFADAPAHAVPAPALAIPDLGARSPELLETRELIDELDAELVNLLARRAELSRRAGKLKAQLGAGVLDAGREKQLREARRQHAQALGLDPDDVDEIFAAILRFSRALQR